MNRLIYIVFILFMIPCRTSAQTPCEMGVAAGYACDDIDFWTHISPEVWGGGTTNEVWGWTDPLDEKEYVLLGTSTGVAFFDIENPESPIYLGKLPTQTFNSLWRTFRVYNNYLFVGSEANNHGLQIFDLTLLRDVPNPPQIFSNSAWYNGFGRCHTLVIHEESGMLFACGTNTFSGGLHAVDITNPLSPQIVGGYSEDGYTHEAQVVTYTGPDQDYQNEVMVFCYNGNAPANLTIVKATDPTDISTVSITPYPQSAYCHQGWLTSDMKYLLMNDELDEYTGVFGNTRTIIWDVQDLDHPIYLGDFLHETQSIDHNLYIKDHLCFQSNYTAGLRVLNIEDAVNLNLYEVAFFDHFPDNDAPTFDGTWMHYPFFESGVIPVSDIDQGLFLLELNFLHVNPTAQQVAQGENAYLQVNVSDGFSQEVQLSVVGLNSNSYSFSENNQEAPFYSLLTISTEILNAGTLELEIVAQTAIQQYRRRVSISIVPSQNYCADIDENGVVGANDLLLLNDDWDCGQGCIGDINQDGQTDTLDLLILLEDYGEDCQP